MSETERSFIDETPPPGRPARRKGRSAEPSKTSRAKSGAKSGAKSASGKPPIDKRERILRAAIKVFARKGFYATRVSEIAKAAGVADGTIYLYFQNKDDVLVSIFQDRITKLVQFLREELGKLEGFEARFGRLVEVQLGLLEGHRDLAEVVTVNLRQSSRLLKQYAAPLFTEYLEVVANLIQEGQSTGTVRADVHPFIVARSLWGALDGVALTWALRGGEAGELQRAASQIAAMFLDGLRATPNNDTRPKAE